MSSERSEEQAIRKDPPIDARQIANELQERGAVEISAAQLPMPWPAWKRLEELSDALPYEEIIEGDAGDKHTLWVGRFMNDVERPTHLHHSSPEVVELLTSPELIALFKQISGEEQLCIRRCQINLLREGGFVGRHVDQDANPDYLLAVILHFSDKYEGGEYVVHSSTCGIQQFKPQAPSILIGRGDVPHEVAKVISGERKTLVFFLSTNFDETKQSRAAVTVTERELDT